MDVPSANAALETAKDLIENSVRNLIANDTLEAWEDTVDTIIHQMNDILRVIPQATRIPLFLIAIDHYYPKASRTSGNWPDWRRICDPDTADLQNHEWWLRVHVDGETAAEAEPTTSVLGKRKAEESNGILTEQGAGEKESVGEASGGDVDADKMQVDDGVDTDTQKKVKGKQKAQDSDRNQEVERGRKRHKRQIGDPKEEPRAPQPLMSTIRVGARKEQPRAPQPLRSIIRMPRDSPTPSTSPPTSPTSSSSPSPTTQKAPLPKVSNAGRTAHPAPCVECGKKNICCTVAKSGSACSPCQVSKRKCSYALRRGRSASRAPSRATSRPPSPSKSKEKQSPHSRKQSPPLLPKIKVRPPSRLPPATEKPKPEVVVKSRPILKNTKSTGSRSARSPTPPIAGPSGQSPSRQRRSTSARARAVPPANVAPTAGATPGRAYLLNGIAMVTKAEFDTLRADFTDLRKSMGDLREQQAHQVDLVTRWAEQYQAMRADLRQLQQEKSALEEEVRELRKGYTAIGRVVESVRREVCGAPRAQVGGLELGFALNANPREETPTPRRHPLRINAPRISSGTPSPCPSTPPLPPATPLAEPSPTVTGPASLASPVADPLIPFPPKSLATPLPMYPAPTTEALPATGATESPASPPRETHLAANFTSDGGCQSSGEQEEADKNQVDNGSLFPTANSAVPISDGSTPPIPHDGSIAMHATSAEESAEAPPRSTATSHPLSDQNNGSTTPPQSLATTPALEGGEMLKKLVEYGDE